MPKKELVTVDGRELALSNLTKVLFPASGFTKGDVIAYYSDVAEVILPHLVGRPLTLKRYPDGIKEAHFYEKNAPSYTPEWVQTFEVPRESGGSPIRYVLCNDRATLVWATNLADIEKHVVLAHSPQLDRPTSLVFDLDPGEPANILDCAEIALQIRDTLKALGLECFVKVSGSKGVHLNVPLNSDVTYEQTQPFAKAIADLLTQRMPKRVVSDMAKKLRKGKVLIDWSQNSDFKTTVCVYALRAKDEPWISMPVTWGELAKAVKNRETDSLYFSPSVAVKRIERKGDLFASVLELQQELPASFLEALDFGPKQRLSSWQRGKSLTEYTAKRDLNKTPEPAAGVAKKEKTTKAGGSFVIQKHQASHLHYDFRLEMEGVLRSWAVPKGAPTELRESRLAMHVEDHPLEYASFEGTIPPGNYGAGTVMVWDFGSYEDVSGNAVSAFYSGKLHITLRGKKLKGEWILVKDRRSEKDHWLLIKAGQSITISKKADDTSAISGRSLKKISEDNDAQWESNRPSASTEKKAPPRARKAHFIEPMQCKPVSKLPEGDEWLYELKLDGYRCVAVKNGSDVKLVSRNGKPLNARFPQLIEPLSKLPVESLVIDGEVIILDEHGRPSFQLLQNSATSTAPVFFYAFDLLLHDGEEFVAQPLRQRRSLLESVLNEVGDPIRFSVELQGAAEEVMAAVAKLNLEGIVAKRSDSNYEPGQRSGAWVKFRMSSAQEFVIGGYVPGTKDFDALLVGLYEGGNLLYSAKVKNGFVARDKAALLPKLKRLKSRTCLFTNLPEPKGGRWGESLTTEKMKECVWVRPELMCQVEFVEWTEAGHLRHCSFAGMREDKRPRDVVRET